MEKEKTLQGFDELPLEAQRRAIDFIVAFLRRRYRKRSMARKTKKKSLADEAFIGMWRNRDDMKDSTVWVRSLRKREW
jgi:hypothetical protein